MSLTASGAAPVRYGRGFFDLQVECARAVSALIGLPLGRALLDYTNLYVRFGLGRAFDPAHPGWREYLAGLDRDGDAAAWSHTFYLARPEPEPPAVIERSGCFACARTAEDRLRLHFANTETDGHSPLALDRRPQRLAELGALFARVRCSVPGDARVVGASWLYNLQAYRSLFPAAYLATARVLPGRFRHMPLWGQFVDRQGAVKQELASLFRERLQRLRTPGGLDTCFPLPVLTVEAPLSMLGEFYGA